jgi:N-carbamoyl-L-amino-acid hydrolase
MNTRSPMEQPLINGIRLAERHRAIARIGATGRGGVDRQALTPEDTEARKLLLSWVQARGYAATADVIGNLFIRRQGARPELAPVMTGSHLDTQPTGGNFDGVFGVLAGLEVLETLDDLDVATPRPIELVVWMNEEGSRFAPPTMGSAVSAGAIPLNRALATRDGNGASVNEALLGQLAQLPGIRMRELGSRGFAFVEAHIEQGPVLEAARCRIGVVTGIQGLHAYEVEVVGFEAHAGTTPVRARQDALVAAITLIGRLRSEVADPADLLRFTVGRFEVAPGSPNTVPGKVVFSIDLRHPDPQVLAQVGRNIVRLCTGEVAGCAVRANVLLQSSPVKFDARIVESVRSAALRRGFSCMELVSGATHDSKYMAGHTPTGMIFIPCERGISHNEVENVLDADLAAGAQVLCDTVLSLMRTDL